jgi:heptosyltransferase-2
MESAAPHRQHPPSILPPRNLLVRGVNWLGDAVMTTPALRRLREHLPEARISLLTPEKLSQLWRHYPALDEILTIQPGEKLWSISGRIRAKQFDVALILPSSPRSALEARLGRIPRRIGYAQPWRSWLLTEAVAPRPGRLVMPRRSVSEVRALTAGTGKSNPIPDRRSFSLGDSAHQIHDYLHLVSRLGANPAPLTPELEIMPAEIQEAADGVLAKVSKGVQSTRPGEAPVWLGLNPSAAYGPAKCWPAENFATVAREISGRVKNSFWLIFGGPNDWELCERIAQGVGGRQIANFAGQTSLRELMVLLKLCRVLLTNDSGPMHVAAALGTPVVVPFGSTSPDLTGPRWAGGLRHHLLKGDAPCSPCFRRTCPIDFRCMTGITVERVTVALLQALNDSPPKSETI